MKALIVLALTIMASQADGVKLATKSGKPWSCECGFYNKSCNIVCGGTGRLGGKRRAPAPTECTDPRTASAGRYETIAKHAWGTIVTGWAVSVRQFYPPTSISRPVFWDHPRRRCVSSQTELQEPIWMKNEKMTIPNRLPPWGPVVHPFVSSSGASGYSNIMISSEAPKVGEEKRREEDTAGPGAKASPPERKASPLEAPPVDIKPTENDQRDRSRSPHQYDRMVVPKVIGAPVFKPHPPVGPPAKKKRELSIIQEVAKRKEDRKRCSKLQATPKYGATKLWGT